MAKVQNYKGKAMQRFKMGDQVLILPKFAHLYPGTSGVIVALTPDSFRAVFTEYTVLFADGSKADLFEFQLLEDKSDYRLLIAQVIFDSSKETPTTLSRGQRPDQRIILQAEAMDIHIAISRTSSEASIVGLVLERHTNQSVSDAEVTLMKLSTTIGTSRTDSLGTFNFGQVYPGILNIHVLIPAHSLRIFGTFSV